MSPNEISAHLTPQELFWQADFVVKSIMIILVVASVVTWGVAIEKLWRYSSLVKQANRWLEALAGQRSLSRLQNALKLKPEDPFAKIYQAITGEWKETHKRDLHRTESGRNSLKERINRVGLIATGVEVERLQKGLSLLATVGSVAPFIGLFGTVWGIMNSFQGIAASNNTSLSVVAPGIAEALFATALGLVAAIPATIAYNKAAGSLNSYHSRLTTLIGITEVQLSRQLEAGEPIPDENAGSHESHVDNTVSLDAHAHKVPVGGKLVAQGA